MQWGMGGGGGSCKNKLGLSHKAFVKICTTTLNPKVDNSEKNALFHYFAKKTSGQADSIPTFCSGTERIKKWTQRCHAEFLQMSHNKGKRCSKISFGEKILFIVFN